MQQNDVFTSEEIEHIHSVRNKIITITSGFLAKYHSFPWSNMFLTGGSIASLLQNETPNDYDIYCEDDTTCANVKRLIENYHLDDVKDVDPAYMYVMGENGKMITHNAISMKDGTQFIVCSSNSVESTKGTFDFIHCCPHYDFNENKLYISKRQYYAIVNKLLITNCESNVKDKRVQKFIDRGYKVYND